jgi:hypothetical protein
MLVEADDVTCGVAEARGYLGSVGADGLNDFAAMGDDGVHGRSHAVHHDVKEQAGCCGGCPRIQEPLTSPVVSSKAVLPSPRFRMFQPKTSL